MNESTETQNHTQPAAEQSEIEVTTGSTKMLYVATGLISFFFFLAIFFPRQQIAQNVMAMIAQNTGTYLEAKYKSFGLLPKPHIHFEELTVLPINPFRAQFSRLHFKELTIYPNIFKMIPIPFLKKFTPAATFYAEIFSGEIDGSVAMGLDTELSLEAENISIDQVQKALLKNSEGNWKGSIKEVAVDMTVPAGRLSRSDGTINITTDALQIDLAAFSLPIPGLEQINTGKIELKARVERGKLTFGKTTVGDSKSDLDANISGNVRLNRMIQLSNLDLRIDFRLSEKIKKTLGPFSAVLTAYKKGARNCVRVSGSASPMPNVQPCR